MAEIWLATDRGTGRRNRLVVIKKILDHLATQTPFINMFRDEARTSALLNHPNIVKILDLGMEPTACFIAMEFIEGEHLAAVIWRALKQDRPIRPPMGARIIADAAQALDYAHKLKDPNGRPLAIVHRDISPQNILISYDGAVKLVDFGIAKSTAQSGQSQAGTLKGKSSYMSPEQALGQPIDARSDIFALGVVLYELCTSRRVFKHDSEDEVLEMITQRSVMPPSEVNPEINPDLEAIILKAMDKDPERRFQTAAEMADALETYLLKDGSRTSQAGVAARMRELFASEIEEEEALKNYALNTDFDPLPDLRPTSMVSGPHLAALDEAPLDSPGRPPAGPRLLHPWISRIQPSMIMVASGIITLIALLTFLSNYLTAPSGPKRGELLLDSVPQGALVKVNGKAVLTPDQKPVITPARIGGLPYASTQDITLSKTGYEVYRAVVIINERSDGSTIRGNLSPQEGTLIVKVQGQGSTPVTIRVNDINYPGPDYELRQLGTHALRVQAFGPHLDCGPIRQDTMRPGHTTRIQIACQQRAAPIAPHERQPLTTHLSKCRPRGRKSVRVKIRSIPRGEIYSRTDEYLGPSPLVLKMKPGLQQVKIKAKYPDREKKAWICVEPNRRQDWVVLLD